MFMHKYLLASICIYVFVRLCVSEFICEYVCCYVPLCKYGLCMYECLCCRLLSGLNKTKRQCFNRI